MSANELLERVDDLDSFLAFVAALVAEREDSAAAERANPTPFFPAVPQAGGWYNATIETYLEAALAWAQSTRMGQALDLGLPAEPTWRAFAHFLYAGKIYE
jgi:hypothetical protein